MQDDEIEGPQPHPLFPIEEDEDGEVPLPPDVHFISVTRKELHGPAVTAPHLFAAAELTTIEQLHDHYGGGTYELLGRGPGNSRIVARKAYVLPGPSKPMFSKAKEPSEAAPVTPDVVAKLAAMMAPPAQPGGQMQTVIALLTVLSPVLMQWLQNSAQARAASEAAQQNFLATLITQSSQQSDKLVTAMGTLYNARGALPPAGGVASDTTFKDGMEYAFEFMKGQAEGQADGEGEPSIKDFIEIAKLAMAQQSAPSSAADSPNGIPAS